MHYIYTKTTQFSVHFELKENGCAIYPTNIYIFHAPLSKYWDN